MNHWQASGGEWNEDDTPAFHVPEPTGGFKPASKKIAEAVKELTGAETVLVDSIRLDSPDLHSPLETNRWVTLRAQVKLKSSSPDTAPTSPSAEH